jgi:hypothetical protein
MAEAAGVELDRLSEYGLILKNASKSETLRLETAVGAQSLRRVATPAVMATNPKQDARGALPRWCATEASALASAESCAGGSGAVGLGAIWGLK